MGTDYTTITEIPGVGASSLQIEMLFTRYAFAEEFCRGKDVLEVACGTAQGLQYLLRTARSVMGGDYTENLLQIAKENYRDAFPLLRLDAHSLPFRDGSFDVVLMYEAIYYLASPRQFIGECRRVLRKGGVVIICSANREWSDFNPSPFSVRYFSGEELIAMLRDQNFKVDTYAAFPVETKTIRQRLTSFIKQTAVKLHLMPRTMKGKEIFKRLFMGPLQNLPAELSVEKEAILRPIPVDFTKPVSNYKVLYAIGKSGYSRV